MFAPVLATGDGAPGFGKTPAEAIVSAATASVWAGARYLTAIAEWIADAPR